MYLFAIEVNILSDESFMIKATKVNHVIAFFTLCNKLRLSRTGILWLVYSCCTNLIYHFILKYSTIATI